MFRRHPLPRGAGDRDITLIKGMDVFISFGTCTVLRNAGKTLTSTILNASKAVSKPRRERLGRLQPRPTHRSLPERNRVRLCLHSVRWRRAAMHRRPIRCNLGNALINNDDFEEVYVRVAKRSERRRDGNGRDHPHRWRIAMQSHPERCLNIYIHTHVMYAIK